MKRWPLRDVTRDKTADRALGDKVHRATLHTIRKRERLVAEMPDWEELRERAREARLRALDRHDELRARFVSELRQRGINVHSAGSAQQARAIITRLVCEVGSQVIKAKSMTSEEVQLNTALEAAGATVTETDLGELIVQLAGEPPSHVTAPAIHMSTEDIARLFGDKLGMAVPAWARRGETVDAATRRALARELSLRARAHLRERFLSADVGISGANFLVAQTGTVVLLENEGNIQLTTCLPGRHIVLAGIDKLIDTEADLAVLLQLLPVSATAQRQTCYLSLFADAHPDMHVVLLDGGRSRLLHDPDLRDLLTCIRCGACQNVCPVYRNVGGHAYGGAYGGPIGALLMPLLGSAERFGDLPFASPLCGACAETCPVGIPLVEHFLQLRARLIERGAPDELALPLRAASVAMQHSGRMQLGAKLYPLARRLAPLAGAGKAWATARELPRPARESFQSWWQRERADGERRAEPLSGPSTKPPEATGGGAVQTREADQAGSSIPAAPSPADPAERFAQRLAELGPDGETELHRFDDAPAALSWLGERIAEHPPDAVLVEGEPSERRELALGITSAALLIAATGGIVLDLGDRAAGRPATLVDTHIVVARPDQLVGSLAEALEVRATERARGAWHDLQVFVTGPSRTADVEKVLVIPAHGPQRLVVVLCNELIDLSELGRARSDTP